MGDKCNCYRFSPRDSLSGAVAQIADYLSKHPGWNETELRAFVDGLISSAGVETFNGRSGNVTLNKDDVNNLLIANCYFAEADETIESIDVLALYKLGVRIVFTQYSSEVNGYTLAYGIEYYPGSDTAKAYLFSSGSGGAGAIVSVNGKTGTVVLNASDILMNNGDSVEYAVSNAKAIANAAYSPDNPPNYPVTSVNGKTGEITGMYGIDNPPPYPVTSVNGKTGAVTGLYSQENPPPYPVSSVNGKIGVVTGLYDAENQPPYPVSSVNGRTGAVTDLYDASNPPPYPVTSVDEKTGSITSIFTVIGPDSTENGEYSITIPSRTCCLLRSALKPFTTDGTTLPAGNEAGFTLESADAYPGDLLAGYFNRGYIMCKVSYENDTKAVITYKNFGTSAYSVKYGFNILFINGKPFDCRLTIKGYY